MEKFEFKYDEQKYGEVLEWYANVEEIFLNGGNDDREKMLLIDEFNKEKYQAEIDWLKQNKDKLVFNNEFEDVGYAFVDILTIYDENDNEVYKTSFMHEGEADEFINMILE